MQPKFHFVVAAILLLLFELSLAKKTRLMDDKEKVIQATIVPPVRASILFGKWKNELGSVMNIMTVTGQSFSGTYETAVSGNGTSLKSTVNGIVNDVGVKEDATIGFSVNWKYKDSKEDKMVYSTTSWCGTLRSEGTMSTMWFLTRYGPQSDDWESTYAGKDIFNKMK